MTEILLFLAKYCAFLFRPGRFRFVDSRTDESFNNALVILESTSVRLRIAHDRGELLLDFQPTVGGSDEWFSLGPLRGVLLGDRGGSGVLDEGWAQFLGDSLDELAQRFADPAVRSTTIEELHHQEKLRAKELFG